MYCSYSNTEKAVFLLIALFITLVLSIAIRSVVVESQCLEAGYPEYKIDWKFNGYCYRFNGAVDNVAVNLSELDDE